MFSYLYQWIMNISFYMVMVTAVLHVVPHSGYKRYIRFFTGLVLVVMLTDPFLKLLGMGELWRNLYESPAYQEQVEKMEEAARFLDGPTDAMAEDLREAGQTEESGREALSEAGKSTGAGSGTEDEAQEEADDGTRIRVEKIEIGR